MKYRKSMIILVLAVFIFGAASVCASDVATVGEVDSAVELTQADADELVSAEENELISEGNPGTFSELQSTIATTSGSTLTLNKSYINNDDFSSEGITIDRPLTIDGQGNKIDAQGKSSIFKITSDNVILKNILFTKGNTTQSGGAVTFVKSGTVINCNFTYNQAKNYGGAIFFYEDGNVLNCNFDNNKARLGGAFESQKNCNVENCNFTNNAAELSAGAIQVGANYVDIYGIVKNCNFFGNSAGNSSGGAIVFQKGIIENCNFTYNQAGDKGGAVFLNAKTKVINCNFTHNKAVKGGAVFASNSNVTNCNFVNNSASKGVIYVSHSTFYGIINSNIFLNNHACPIYFDNDYSCNCDYNWFGADATDYMDDPNLPNCHVWLFLNATANPDTLLVSDTSDINFKLYVYDSNSKNVSEYDNSILYPVTLTVTATNGNVTVNTVKLGETIEYAAVDLGTGGVTASIEDISYTIELNIVKPNSTLTVSDVVFDYNSTGSTTVSYTNASGVNASVVGQPNAIVDVNGTTITVSGLDAGTYTLTVTTIADMDYNNVTKNATITVNKAKTQLTANAITTTYNVNKDLVITLKDANGNVLSRVNVTVDLNGAKTYVTDANGQIKVSTEGLAPKAYAAKVTFNGNTNYAKSTKDVKVTVKKATPKLTAKKKTFKTTPKTKKYTIVLKDNTGKAIKKAKVTLKVKGKTYKATTNSKGKAVFKIKKLNKKGTYKATITFKGDKNYKKVTKKAKIKVIVTFKTVSRGSKDKSTVKEIQQALKDKGYYISYKGHYLMVDGKFESCTERSVKQFQHDNGLKVTGKVDEKTAKKLGII